MDTLPIPIAFTVLACGCAAGISAPERSPVTLELRTIAGQIVVRHEILTGDSESGAPVIEAIAAAEQATLAESNAMQWFAYLL